MFCPRCGAATGESAAFCANCGSSVKKTPAQAEYRLGPAETGHAGFWKRFAARIIDLIVVGVVTYAIGLVVVYAVGWSGMMVWSMIPIGEPETIIGGMVIGAWVVALLLNWLYFTLLESSGRQATVGKMALGIVVTDLNGGRISFARANARFWSQVLLGLIWLVLVIGYIMAGFTERKQALHDLMASTLVVNRDYR